MLHVIINGWSVIKIKEKKAAAAAAARKIFRPHTSVPLFRSTFYVLTSNKPQSK
jgi:hypothetical protein